MKMKSTHIVSSLVLALTLVCGTANASNLSTLLSANTELTEAVAEGNDGERVEYISSQLVQLKTNLNNAIAMADALGMTAQYQDRFDALAESIQTMIDQFINDLAQGLVDSNYVLEGLSAAQGNISGLMGPLSGQFNAMLNGCFQRSYPVVGQINSTIGQLESKLQGWGLTEQFADQMAEVNAKAQEASAKLSEYQAAVASETDYKKKLELAQEAEAYINGVKDEILAECAEIEAAAQAAAQAKIDANEAAYERLMAQIGELEEYYNEIYALFTELALTQPQGWSRTYGAQLGGIQGAIQGMKATVGAAYGRVELDENSTIDNYDYIKGELDNIYDLFTEIATGIDAVEVEAQFAKGQVYDLSGRRVSVPAKGTFIINGKKVVLK